MGREGPPGQLYLPPGFRFYPTDEELVEDYLCKKTAGHPFSVPIIAEVDLYRFDPWVLPEKALFGEKEWFFFSPRDRKYPNGSRPNRAAGSGYWKATGTDKPICSHSGGHKTLVGVKKALVFYIGKAPKGTKTNWIMHEYRMADASSRAAKRKGSLRLDDWVLCRIYKKTMGAQKAAAAAAAASKECNESSSCLDEVLASLPDIDDKQFINLPRLNSMNLFMEQKPSNTIEAKACADNVSRSCDDQPWMNANNNTNTNTTTTNNNNNHSVSFLMDLGQKADQQFSNGGTDGVVTEVASSRCNYTYPLDALHEFNNNPRRNVNINYDLATALPCRPPRPERQPLMHHQHDSPDHEEVQSTFRIHNNEINLLQPAQPQMGFGYNGSQVQNTFNASQMDPMNMVFDNAFLASLQGSSYMQPRSQ